MTNLLTFAKRAMFRMKKVNILLNSVVILIILSSKAHAYIDPGIGSIILQGIIASIAAIGVFFSDLRKKLSKILLKLKGLSSEKKNDIKK